jgi:superfamily II DNA or RNA helicase
MEKSAFLTESSLRIGSWQNFERAVCRLLICEGYENVRLVGGTGDKGADVVATRNGKRFVYQIKHWAKPIGSTVVDETLRALRFYNAQVPVIVALSGFDTAARERQSILMANRVPLQLVGPADLERRAKSLATTADIREARSYQEPIIQAIASSWNDGNKCGLVVMATGLGKTFTAAEGIRRIGMDHGIKTLVLAHTNELVYQLERAFWPFLSNEQKTAVWNGYERPTVEAMTGTDIVFACHKSVAEHLSRYGDMPDFDMVLVDECHHVGGKMYLDIIERINAGKAHGPYLLGLTATPWRPDDVNLEQYFGSPLASVDIVHGLKNGFLSNVDYRMHTDNIDWENLAKLKGSRFSPKHINRTLFITEWNDAVIDEIKTVWGEVERPRAIVFCGTIDHAITMRDKINSLGFCRAEALYSNTTGFGSLTSAERSRILCDFHDGVSQVLCAVDILNEGIDVPDVNIIVFQRVTHSRRIFVQQLGRGLRLSKNKKNVVVLDFVSDIRRFAAGLDLQTSLNASSPTGPISVRINSKVTFRKVGGADERSAEFLRQWLEDVAAIEDATDDASVLRFPPMELSGRNQ